MLKLLIDRWTDTDSRWSIAFSRARARCPYCRYADLRSTKHIGQTRNGEATEVTRKNALRAVGTAPCACGRLVSMPNTFLQRRPYGTNVCRYNWHSAGSPGWPLPMLKCSLNIFFQIKYTEAALSNNTRKLLWFEITRMRIAVQKINLLSLFGTLNCGPDVHYPAVCMGHVRHRPSSIPRRWTRCRSLHGTQLQNHTFHFQHSGSASVAG